MHKRASRKREALLSKGHKYDFKTSVLENLNDIVFFTQKPDDGEYIQILGLVNKAKANIQVDKRNNMSRLEQFV